MSKGNAGTVPSIHWPGYRYCPQCCLHILATLDHTAQECEQLQHLFRGESSRIGIHAQEIQRDGNGNVMGCSISWIED